MAGFHGENIIGIYTGLRLGDCAMMEWGSIDLARNRIVTIPRKTVQHAHGKPVVIPLHPTLAIQLSEIPPEDRTGFLMPELAAMYARDSGMIPNRIQRIFADAGIRTQTKETNSKRRARRSTGCLPFQNRPSLTP